MQPPEPIRKLRPDVPAELERVVTRCLEKDADGRYGTTGELAAALRALGREPVAGPVSALALLRRPVVATPLAGAVLSLAIAGVLWTRGAERRWAERDALAEITRLTEAGDLFEAYRTALRAEEHRPDDPELQAMFERMTVPVVVNTDPPGAEVAVKGYATPNAEWERVGVTPMTIRFPYAMMRWRITREGYESFEGAPFSGATIAVLAQGLELEPEGTRPPGMVRIPGGQLATLPTVRPPDELPAVLLEPYHLDRHEVTNRQYGEFVRAGGYAREEWWPDPVLREGREVPRRDAMRRFVDATGRPGPSTWEAGVWPAGEDDHPVGGISWYEAAAYCRYAGKSLPTVYHWFSALGQEQLSDILTQSNIGGEAKAPVGRFQGLGGYGTYDMAGNVKEWAWNAAGEGRYILGGAWNEPAYLFQHLVAQDPLGREPTNGVRCAKYAVPPAEPLSGEVIPQHKYDRPPALSDEAFAVVQGMYVYDRGPLEARLERVDDRLPAYRRETVSFRSAYGSGRMEVHLLMPRGTAPPYQPVIWFPGSDVFLLRSSEHLASAWLFDFIPRSGRVLVYPVYKGMYERFEPPGTSPSALRDQLIRWAQDLGRTIDYLGTRPDFDTGEVAYYGFSLGAIHGPVFSAIEPRITASILLGGGLVPMPSRPEVHLAALAPRSLAATLMINGRDDFIMPYELSQKPLFDLLGAPADRKRLARLDGGHIPTDRREIIREVLDWLDRQLGPVVPVAASTVNRPGPR
jgi:formylglycine-generating enzyme required for sulfatase activity